MHDQRIHEYFISEEKSWKLLDFFSFWIIFFYFLNLGIKSSQFPVLEHKVFIYLTLLLFVCWTYSLRIACLVKLFLHMVLIIHTNVTILHSM